MTNQEFIKAIEKDKKRTVAFREKVNKKEIMAFLSEINFDLLNNIHKEILLILLKEGPLNIYQVKKALYSSRVTNSYSYTHKIVKQLEKKKYVTLRKEGDTIIVQLIGKNVFEVFGQHE
jgi:hypothetical protein